MERTHSTHGDDHPADSLICAHAFSGERPVLFVYREADGFWTFTCGQEDHQRTEDVLPVCHGCALDENDLRGSLGDLPPGHEASREAVGALWSISSGTP